jgi:hypothetical protein
LQKNLDLRSKKLNNEGWLSIIFQWSPTIIIIVKGQ